MPCDCGGRIEAWLKASRLRLNPTKTQDMWLGSRQLLARLDIMAAVPVLSSSVRVQETARDLDMVTDSRLSLSDHCICFSTTMRYINRHYLSIDLSISLTDALHAVSK